MPNFDFLRPDDFGRSRRLEPAGLREPRYPIWLWSFDFSPRLYYMACLTDDTLFVTSEYESVGERAADIAELCYREPESVFHEESVCVPLDTIRRLRFDEYYSWLYIDRTDGTTETISDFETGQTESIFATLHQLLAPRAPIDREPIRNQRDFVILVSCFVPVAFIAGLFLTTALSSAEALGKLRPTDFRVMLINAIGAPLTIVLCLVPILAFLAFAAYKYFYPRRALAVTVRRYRLMTCFAKHRLKPFSPGEKVPAYSPPEEGRRSQKTRFKCKKYTIPDCVS